MVDGSTSVLIKENVRNEEENDSVENLNQDTVVQGTFSTVIEVFRNVEVVFLVKRINSEGVSVRFENWV